MNPSPSTEPEVVIEDPRIDRGAMMYADLPYDVEPQFRIGEVCKVFFGRSDHWLRWLQKAEPATDGKPAKPNYLVLDGREVGTRKIPLKCDHCGVTYERCRDIMLAAEDAAVEHAQAVAKAEDEGLEPPQEAPDLPTTCCADCQGPSTHPTHGGSRIFGLRDVEEITYALAQQGRIDGEQMRHALVALDTIGRIWKVR